MKKILTFGLVFILLTAMSGGAIAQEPLANYVFSEGVAVSFDSNPSVFCRVLHTDDYPCMEIEKLAEIIGGSVTDGKTLIKGDKSITYTAGSKLAEDKGGHLMLERAPSIQDGELYVPVSSLLPVFYYTMYYNRFDKTLELKSGTDYPKSQRTFYAKDYGAVGDGVHDDLHPILEAIDAAISSGVPATVELEANKTYLVGTRHDAQSILLFENVENFTLDGKGSEIIIDKATNSPLDIRNSANVKIKNLDFDYNELTFTQGRITYIDKTNHIFRLKIDEGYILPADDAWVHHFWGPTSLKSPHLGGWSFGTVMDPVEDRIHLDRRYDEIFVKTVEPYQGREYTLTVLEGYYPNLNEVEVGDRFVLNTRFNSYDIGTETLDGLIRTAAQIYASGDITLENVNFYQAHWNGLNMGMCWGRIFLTNVGVKTRDGRLMSCNSDTLHMWRCRGGVVMDGCTFENNMDDHMNIKTESGAVLEHNDYSYVIDYDLHMRIGDELMFMNALDGGTVLGTAFIKAIEIADGQGWRVTVDRPIDGVIDGTEGLSATKVFNLESCGRGSVIKNSTFRNSRRSPFLCKSPNTLFDNNTIENCGGSGFKGSPESAASGKREGVYPSSCTVRNNTMTYEGQIQPNGPIAVFSDSTPFGGQAKIKDVLIENNYIDSNNPNNFIYIHSVDGLYMYNNTLKSESTSMPKTNTPVIVQNTRVEEIDGLTLDFASNVDAAVTLTGCAIDQKDIKNIDILGGNTAEPYVITGYVDSEVNYRDGIYWLSKEEQSADGEVIIASVDLKIKRGAFQGFCLRFIANDTVPVGAIRFNQHGLVLTENKAQSWGATWLEQYQNANNDYVMTTYERDKWYNLKVKLDKEKGTVDYYLDGQWIGQDTGDLSEWTGHWTHITPVGLESDKAFFEWKVKAIVSGARDEVFAFCKLDEENKRLTVDVSQATEKALDEVKFKKVNTSGVTEAVELIPQTAVGTALEYTYEKPLSLDSQYAVILSEEIVADRYIYLKTREFDAATDELFDFETEEKTFKVDINNNDASKQYVMGKSYYVGGEVVKSEDTARGNVIQLSNVISHNGGTSYGLYGEYQWNGPVASAGSDITAYSFDIKPLKPDLQVAIRIKSEGGGVPLGLAFGKSGYILSGFNWFDRSSTNVDDIAQNSRKNMYIGDYNTSNWISFRIEYDKLSKLARIYMNGELVKTVTNTNTAYDGLKWASFVVHSGNMSYAEGEPLLLLDNVRTETVTRPFGVSNISFVDTTGNESGAFGAIKQPLSYICLYFDEDSGLTSGKTDNIVLTYDGETIDYKAEYSEDDFCYKLTPAKTPMAGQKIMVSVSKLSSNGRVMEDFKAYASVGDIWVQLSLCDSSGKPLNGLEGMNSAYVCLTAENTTGADGEVYVLTAQYKDDGTLVAVDNARTITVKSGGKAVTDYASADKIAVVPEASAAVIKAFVWSSIDTLRPLCESVYVER